MFSTSQRLVFLFFAALVAASFVSARSGPSDAHVNLHARRVASLPYREPGSLGRRRSSPMRRSTPASASNICGPSTCSTAKQCNIGKAPTAGASSAVKTRSLLERGLSLLQSRAFSDTDKPDTYVPDRFSGNNDVQAVVFAESGNSISTGVLKKFSDYPQELDIGVEHMAGCASLIIVSDKAVYFTHYWEEGAFPKTKNGKATTGYSVQVVQALIRGLEYGKGKDNLELQPSLESNKALFAGANPKAYIMAPAKSASDDSQLYASSVAIIEATVKKIVGASTPVKVQTYKKPVSGSGADAYKQKGADGMALFQKNGDAKRIFIEQTKYDL